MLAMNFDDNNDDLGKDCDHPGAGGGHAAPAAALHARHHVPGPRRGLAQLQTRGRGEQLRGRRRGERVAAGRRHGVRLQ